VDGVAIACHADSVYDQPSPGRRFGPALISFLAVLAIVSGALGYFGTKSMLANGPTPTAGHTTNPPGGPTTSSTPPHQGGSPTTPASPTRAGPTVTQVPAGDSKNCPAATATAFAAAGLNANLQLLLYLRVHRPSEIDSEIWICQNADGVLIYQGHILSSVLDTADNALDTLLLADGIKGTVVREGTDGFLASNPNNGVITEYHVTPTRLVQLTQPGDRDRTEYPAVVSYVP
jgi:hypothetical protein